MSEPNVPESDAALSNPTIENDPSIVPTSTDIGMTSNTLNPSFLDGLPDELRTHPTATKHPDLTSLVKEHVNAVHAVGKKGVILPKEGDAADLNRFQMELGRPETIEQYELGDFEVPENMPWLDTIQDGMLNSFFKNGVNSQQAQGMMQDYVALQQVEMQNAESIVGQVHEETMSTLGRELGAAMEPRLNMASRAIQHIFGESGNDVLEARMSDGSKLGDNIPFIKAMIAQADSIGEDTLHTDHTQGVAAAMSPDEAVSQRERLMADETFSAAYFNNQHPEHKAALAKIDELYAYAQGQGSIVNVSSGVGSGGFSG